jgi:DNA polymerase III delta subunit
MVDDFLEKKKTDFILRLNRELSIGTKVEQIIGFLYKTLLRIFLLKKAKNIKDEEKLNLNYFYKQKLKMYTKKFNDEEIKRAINYLAEIDRKYKKFLLKEEDVPYEILKILEK